MQHWLVGRFEGPTKGYEAAWNEFEIPSSFWAIALSPNIYPQLDYGLYWGSTEAWTKLLGLIYSLGV